MFGWCHLRVMRPGHFLLAKLTIARTAAPKRFHLKCNLKFARDAQHSQAQPSLVLAHLDIYERERIFISFNRTSIKVHQLKISEVFLNLTIYLEPFIARC